MKKFLSRKLIVVIAAAVVVIIHPSIALYATILGSVYLLAQAAVDVVKK